MLHARGRATKKVKLVNYSDGGFRPPQRCRPFRVFDKIQTVAPGAIVDNKRVAFAREQ